MGALSGSSERGKPLAAGPAIASALGLAAGLAELTASVSGHEELEARAVALRQEVEPLGDEDARAYAALLRGEPGARERTIAVPARLAELAAEIRAVCALAAERGKPALQGDAQTGVLLAEAAGRAAANLVAVNRRDADSTS